MVPTQLTQREGQDFLWHHQELPLLRASAARPTEARSHCEARDPPLKNNMQRVSISLPPEHHMVRTVWAMGCFLCISGELQHKSTEHITSSSTIYSTS